MDEDRIDFDLLEELVTYIDQDYGEGAILVFLPGTRVFAGLPPHYRVICRFTTNMWSVY